MKYARKIPLSISHIKLRGKTFLLGDHVIRKTFSLPKVSRQYIPQKHLKQIKSLLPEEIHGLIAGIDLSDIRLIHPHIHTTEQCALNFYIDTSGEKTSFFEGEVKQDDEDTVDNGNAYLNVKAELLTEVESFVATSGDAWLISTAQPHAVSGEGGYTPTNTKTRSMVQVFFTAPFSEISRHLP